ncbi:MAG TPA: hypothetical protein VH682_23030 [Gemmataceae bacterium]|jgi:hypothetical protein
MSSLPSPVRPVPSASPAVLPLRVTLLVRLSVLTPHGRTRHNNYVTIERTTSDSDADLFVKTVREYRHGHGYIEQIVAIDLLPNQ